MIKIYTPEQQKNNLRLAVDALRKNERKATGDMYNETGGRCCLCVMSNLAEDIDGVPRDTYTAEGLPLARVGEVYGLPNSSRGDGALFNFSIGGHDASCLNDNGKTHREIAGMIEKEFLTGSKILRRRKRKQ